MVHLLLLDDDPTFCCHVERLLLPQGFTVEATPCPVSARARLADPSLTLALLATHLNGFALLRELRQSSALPTFLLASTTVPDEMIAALELGADDFLIKPVPPPLLLARIRAVLRRCPTAPRPVRHGLLAVDPCRADATYAGRLLGLTAMEFAILLELARLPGVPVSRDQLALRLHQRPASPTERSVDTHIARIRRKLGPAAALIRSVRGAGYALLPAPPA
jgi:DNA-binding response OmpR family regulator